MTVSAPDDLMLVGGGRVCWWGSDCVLDGGCGGNTTPGSMRCDACGSDEFTVPLYEGLAPFRRVVGSDGLGVGGSG